MKPKSSQYRGVCFHKVHRKWFAYVQLPKAPFAKRQRCRGLFATELEAAQAYNDMAIEVFGDAAKLNVLPPEPPPPEPHEIAAACAAIRATWSERDYAERAPHLNGRRPELLQMRMADVLSAA